jgi:DNA repair protein RadA/Sms
MRALTAPTIVAALEHLTDIADHRAGAPPGPLRLDA